MLGVGNMMQKIAHKSPGLTGWGIQGGGSSMKHLSAIVCAAGLLTALGMGSAQAATVPKTPMPESTPALLNQGQTIYFERCSFCHGLSGDGEGPAAPYMDPRPRDFTLGTFKFRTTVSGELPTNEDLFRTVSRGLPGTGMQAFDDQVIKNGLSEDERWAVISYIKTFAPEFADPTFDPVTTGMVLSLPANRPPYSPELVAKGAKAFEAAKCWSCHGKGGRGDGNKEFRKDDWGFPIRIRNVTHPWKIKGGSSVEQIYMRFTSGISGTPMPSFVKTMNEDDRWALANFIKSLQHKLTEHQVLKAVPVVGELPMDPTDAQWSQAEPMDVRLTGQVVVPPRWQNPGIEMVTMRALVNENDIAFRLTWDDPFKDVVHDTAKEFDPTELQKVGIYNSYVQANDQIVRQLETFRDAIALQFAIKPSEGAKKPHFVRGESSNAVNLWMWDADKAEAGETAAFETVARGWKRKPKLQAEDQQQIQSQAIWDQGQWNVVIKRSRMTEDKNDVQFREGAFTPVSLNAWDGSNGEHGMIMSLSSWYFVFIEAPMPMSLYVYTALAVLVIGGLGFRWARKEEEAAEGGTSAADET